MSFHEIQFPTNISLGSAGGPGFKTYITEVDSGAEQRTARRSTPRYRFDIAYGVKTFQQLGTVKSFYNARLGCANGFRFKDPNDYCSTLDGMLLSTGLGAANVANTDQQIGIGDGTTTSFQLIKKYTDAASSTTRIITKPVHTNGAGHGSGTVVVAKDAVSATTGWTVNSISGIVTFSVAPGVGVVVTAGFQFDVPVRFGAELDEALATTIDEFNSGAISSIPLVELVSPVTCPSDIYYGGADNKTFSADISLSASDARVQSMNPQSAGLGAKLPPLADMPFGGPTFYLINESVTNTLIIKDSTGATLDTMPIGPKVWEVFIKKNSGGSKVWDFMK